MKRKIIVFLCVLPLLIGSALLLGYNFHVLLSQSGAFDYRPGTILTALREVKNVRVFSLVFAVAEILLILVGAISTPSAGKLKNDTVSVCPGILIPASAGHGEYGTARLMRAAEMRKVFCRVDLKKRLAEVLENHETENGS